MSLAQAERLKRLDRWTQRDRLRLDGLSWPGARLLDRRLEVRRRTAWATAGLWVAAAICFVATPSADVLPVRRLDAGAWWSTTGTMLVGGAVWVRCVLIRRGEQRIAAELPRRVTSDHAVSPWRRIGLVRLANGVLIFGSSLVVLCAVVTLAGNGLIITLYAVLFVLMTLIAVFVAWRDVARGSVAVDEVSLRVDDRWRSQSVYVALAPLGAVSMVGRLFLPMSPGPGASTWLRVLFLYGPAPFLAVGVLEMLAQALDRRRLGQPAPCAKLLHRP